MQIRTDIKYLGNTYAIFTGHGEPSVFVLKAKRGPRGLIKSTYLSKITSPRKLKALLKLAADESGKSDLVFSLTGKGGFVIPDFLDRTNPVCKELLK